MSQAAAAPAAPPAAPVVKTYTQAELDAAVSAARDEGRTAGADAERARILGIEKAALPGHAELIAGLKADGKTTPAEAALRVVEAEQAQGANRLAAIRGVEDATGKVPAESSALGDGQGDKAKQKPRGEAAEGQALAAKATQLIAEQAKLGIKLSAAEAVARVSEGG